VRELSTSFVEFLNNDCYVLLLSVLEWSSAARALLFLEDEMKELLLIF